MKFSEIAKTQAFNNTVSVYLHTNIMRIMQIDQALARYGNCLVTRYGTDWVWIDTPNVT